MEEKRQTQSVINWAFRKQSAQSGTRKVSKSIIIIWSIQQYKFKRLSEVRGEQSMNEMSKA